MLACCALLVLAVSDDYAKVKAHFVQLQEQTRVEMANARSAEAKAKVLSTARARLIERFESELFPAWAGTAWDFYGMSEKPREGQIACGYYISTLLRDAGFKVDRVKLAQQASANIARTVASDSEVHWYRELTIAELLPKLRADSGEGLYVVGLPNHVVFLRLTKDDAKVCHANYLEDVTVTCEDALTAPALQVGLFVTAPLFDDALLHSWLEGRAIPTVTRAREPK